MPASPDLDPLFAAPGEAWQPVSPRLATARRVVVGVVLLLVLVVGGVLTRLLLPPRGPVVVALVVVLALAGWAWWIVGRNAASYAWAERDEDLYLRHGVLFRKLVAVPYGRMQYVDVRAGPLDQALGIARVQLHTASPGTSAVVPGLPADEAARLRDRLTARGHAEAAGL